MYYLASLSKEQQFQWYREHQYCYPIGFGREIGEIVYIVTAHFSKNASDCWYPATRPYPAAERRQH